MPARPLIGITCDINPAGRIELRTDYAEAVDRAGGMSILMHPQTERIPAYLALCHGFVFTGGDDPLTEPFGEPTHPMALPVHPKRQLFETALIKALDNATTPVLGICLGMQWMALHAGGSLYQYLPDHLTPHQAEMHRENQHLIHCTVEHHPLLPTEGFVTSHHRQAVAETGTMRICAQCNQDKIIEAIDLPGTDRFYLGVQWHPERTDNPLLGQNLFDKLVKAAARIEQTGGPA